MSSMSRVDVIFAVVNGWLFILVLAMAMCVISYLRTIQREFKIPWKFIIFQDHDNRPGIRLAKPMLLFKLGAVGVFGMAWIWQVLGVEHVLPHWQFYLYLTALLILTTGSLWLVRVFTWVRFGEKAWLITLVSLVSYLGISFVVYQRIP